jgi:uncharacterized protein YecT (DUF1311 family)
MSHSNSTGLRRYLTPGMIAIGVFLATSAWQPCAADPNDAKIIQDCVTANSELQCIGKVFALCAPKPSDMPLQAQTACFAREYQAWDSVLNDTYQRLATQVDPAAKPKIAGVKTNWAAARQQTCEFFAAAHAGDLAAMRLNICLQTETANRVYLIMSMTSMF